MRTQRVYQHLLRVPGGCPQIHLAYSPTTLNVIRRTRRVRQTAIKLQKILTTLKEQQLKKDKLGIKCTLTELKNRYSFCKPLKCTFGILGKYAKHVFGIPS